MCYTSYSTTAGMAYNLVSLLSLIGACFACPNYISLYKLVDNPNLGSGRGLCLSHLHSAPNHIVIVPMPTPASWPFERAPQLCVHYSLCIFHCLCRHLACGGFVSSLSGHWAESEKRTGTIRMVIYGVLCSCDRHKPYARAEPRFGLSKNLYGGSLCLPQ